MRSLNSVSLASVAPEPQTNLVSIWAAFEALLPEPKKDGERSTRIKHFAPLIVPCAVYDYASDNFVECYRNCQKQFGNPFTQLVRAEGVGDSDEQKFASLFVAEQALKERLLGCVCASPLILNRFFRLELLLTDPQNLTDLLETHERRVTWQINRIYRERNIIVHNSSQSAFLEALIENAYGYYRSVFLALERVNAKHKVSHPDRALELVKKKYRRKHSNLKAISKDSNLEAAARSQQILHLIFEDLTCH